MGTFPPSLPPPVPDDRGWRALWADVVGRPDAPTRLLRALVHPVGDDRVRQFERCWVPGEDQPV